VCETVGLLANEEMTDAGNGPVYCVHIFSFTGNLGDFLYLYYLGNVME